MHAGGPHIPPARSIVGSVVAGLPADLQKRLILAAREAGSLTTTDTESMLAERGLKAK